MITLTAGKELLDLLLQANEPAEIRDESGSIVGVFSPVKVSAAAQMRRKARTHEEEDALLAELERRATDPRPDCTFREAFEHLLSLAKNPAEQVILREKIARFKEREQCDSQS